MIKLKSKELRKRYPKPIELKKIKRNPIYLVLDRIIDTYNIGSLFRLADAIAAQKIFLCEEMEYPPSSKIHKAAVGTEAWVPWTKSDSTLKTIKDLKESGIQIIAVEQSPQSISYTLFAKRLRLPCAVILGNETTGISPEVLKMADLIVELPMYGVNKSFNVWGSAAVIAYKILENLVPSATNA